jgi:hypothetical protein
MTESVKLTEEEIKDLETATNRVNALRKELADISMIKLNLELREDQAKKFHQESIEFEQTLAKNLEEKYGKGTVDIDKGIFMPLETE